MEQWEPHLRDLGIHVSWEPFESPEMHSILHAPGRVLEKSKTILAAFGRRVGTIRDASSFDVVYVFRESALLGPAAFERYLDHLNVPYVFDFDDAVFIPYRSVTNGYLSLLKYPPRTKTACRLAAHVMAGNRYLADYASKHNANVTIVPTTIDLAKYTVAPADRTGPAVIGWSGSQSTVQHLDTAVSALAAVARAHECRVNVIGTSSYSIPGVQVDARSWNSGTEIEDLRRIEIGIMPMPDDAWSRGKCGLKALQYMALGIPTVCSPVGVNAEIIRDGENGFLASTEAEWVDRLSRLLESEDLRRRIGAAGRRTVEERFDGAHHARRVADIFRAVGGQTSPATTGASAPGSERIRPGNTAERDSFPI